RFLTCRCSKRNTGGSITLAFCARPRMFADAECFMKSLFLFLSVAFVASNPNFLAAELKTLDDFRPLAAKANAVLTIPDWEQTPKAVEAMMTDAIAKANKALDQIGSQDLKTVTFKSTVVALDDLTYEAGLAANRATIIKETNTSPQMRAA